MGKWVVGSDGIGRDVPLTPEEEAQAVLDAQAAAEADALRAAIEARADTFVADTERANLLERLLNASPAEIETYIDNNITLSGTNITQLRNEVQAILRVVVKRIVKVLVLNILR